MAKWKRMAFIAAAGVFLPLITQAQGMAEKMNGLRGVLDQLYDEMIPLCNKLISVGQGIAGFAAIWYISSRIWRHIANAEPIDFYPLFRPFVLGFCVMIFPSILAMINGIMEPTVKATSKMVKGSNKAITVLLQQKEEALKRTDSWKMYVGQSGNGDRDRWYRYTYGEDPSKENLLDKPGNALQFYMDKQAYQFSNRIKKWMSEVLEVLFEAAALCIDTLRTFQLVVLAILGPLVFGLAVFDGFQHTLTAWIARYINIFLWLPVANIFGALIGKVQEKMIALDISQLQTSGNTFFSTTDVAYLVFMIIGIVGYFTVPSIANYIIHAGGGGGMLRKVTNMTTSVSRMGTTRALETGRSIAGIGRHLRDGYGASGSVTESAGKAVGKSGAYMANKLSGK